MDKYVRLTERNGTSVAIKDTSTNDNISIWNAIERLAELEDKIDDGRLWFTSSSGLRPSPFECAKRWEELWYEVRVQYNAFNEKIKNGTLMEFSCKVGDTVYWISSNCKIITAVVKSIRVVDSGVIYSVLESGVGEYTVRDIDFYHDRSAVVSELKKLKGD